MHRTEAFSFRQNEYINGYPKRALTESHNGQGTDPFRVDKMNKFIEVRQSTTEIPLKINEKT